MSCSHANLPVYDDLVEGSIDAAHLQATGFSLKLSNCYVINIVDSV